MKSKSFFNKPGENMLYFCIKKSLYKLCTKVWCFTTTSPRGKTFVLTSISTSIRTPFYCIQTRGYQFLNVAFEPTRVCTHTHTHTMFSRSIWRVNENGTFKCLHFKWMKRWKSNSPFFLNNEEIGNNKDKEVTSIYLYFIIFTILFEYLINRNIWKQIVFIQR